MAIHPEDTPDMGKLQGVLKPAEMATLRQAIDDLQNAHTEIGRMSPKLLARVKAEMEADGRLPSMAPIKPNAGRSLEGVTDWLWSKGIDSTAKTLKERLDLAGRAADAIEGARTAYQKAKVTADALWKAAVESYKAPPKDTDFRNVIKSWISEDQRTGLANHQFVKELVAKVPNVDRRKAISVWLDADGDASVLKAQEPFIPPAYQKAWKIAQNLTPDEKSLALKIKQDFADKLEDGLAVGLLEKGREDYGVPQRWEIKPDIEKDPAADPKRGTPGRPDAQLDPRNPFFSFQRETPSYFEGIMAKGVPENLDIAHLVEVYDQAFHKSLSSRSMINALQQARAKDGLPVVKISGSAQIMGAGEGKAFAVD
jgi:hypothetical protein